LGLLRSTLAIFAYDRGMKLFQNIIGIFLAALLWIGATGFTVEKFYCGSYLRSIHVFSSPEPCCNKTNTPEGRCRTESEYVEAEISGVLPVFAKKIEKPLVATAILPKLVQLFSNEFEISPIKYLHYIPPLLLKDISVLLQSFLI